MREITPELVLARARELRESHPLTGTVGSSDWNPVAVANDVWEEVRLTGLNRIISGTDKVYKEPVVPAGHIAVLKRCVGQGFTVAYSEPVLPPGPEHEAAPLKRESAIYQFDPTVGF